LRGVKRGDQVVSRLCVQTESVSQALQLWRLFQIVFLQSVTTSMEVLFNCVEAHIQDSRLRGGKVLLKL
jgi:hypothetical protein